MSESKHTPGPWRWWTSNSWRRLKHDDRGKTLNVLEPYVCSDGIADLLISEADMALIAAAPDMLKALKQIHYYETIRDPNRGALFLGALHAVEAAIAKATNPVTSAIASGRAPTVEEVADVVGKGERS